MHLGTDHNNSDFQLPTSKKIGRVNAPWELGIGSSAFRPSALLITGARAHFDLGGGAVLVVLEADELHQVAAAGLQVRDAAACR